MDCFSNCIMFFLFILFILFLVNIPKLKDNFSPRTEGSIRYIRIESENDKILSLAKVKVLDMNGTNIALKKDISSSKFTSDSSQIISDTENLNSNSLEYYNIESNDGLSYFQIDLGDSYQISKISIYSKEGEDYSRIGIANIKLLDYDQMEVNNPSIDNNVLILNEKKDGPHNLMMRTFNLQYTPSDQLNNKRKFPTIGLTKKGDKISVKKFGIGVDNPQSLLDIKGDDNGSNIRLYHLDDDKKYTEMKNLDDVTSITSSGDNPIFKVDIKDHDTVANALYFDRIGLGLGTSDPKSMLDVRGALRSNAVDTKEICLHKENIGSGKEDETSCLNFENINTMNSNLETMSTILSNSTLTKISTNSDRLQTLEKSVASLSEQLREIRNDRLSKQTADLNTMPATAGAVDLGRQQIA